MKDEKKNLMVDMDDVITTGGFVKAMEEFLGEKIDITKAKSFYLQELLGDRKSEFFENFDRINLYKEAELMEDCYDVLKELNGKYRTYICTDYIWPEAVSKSGPNLRNKYEFLLRKLDFLSPRNYIFAADKSIMDFDIRIDDKLINLETAETKLLFDSYHNKEYADKFLKENGVVRVNNWIEIAEILL